MESVLESILAREGRFDTIDLDLARQAGLRAADLTDAYAELKRVANDAALLSLIHI